MEHLIESVRKYPCLWKIDSSAYKDNELKEAAWREVIKDCDLPNVKEAKTLWKKLRDGHRQATGTRKKSTSGQQANNTAKWKYEDQMSFLLPNMRNRPVHTNILTNTMNEDSEVSNDSELLNTSTSGEQQHASVSGLTSGEQQTASVSGLTSGEQQTASVSSYENSQPRKKNKSIVSVLEQGQKQREKRSADRDLMRKLILENNYKNVSPRNTAMEKFFMSMCDTTSELPAHLQMRVQRQVFNVVMEAREHNLMQTTSYASPGHTTNYSMSLASSPNSPIHAVSPNSLRSNSASTDYLISPGHYSLQSPPTDTSTPMMPANTNDTESIPQFSQENSAMSADTHSSVHHVYSVQNLPPESSSQMMPQNTTTISTHDSEDLRSYLVNFDLPNN